MLIRTIRAWSFFIVTLMIPVTAFSIYNWYEEDLADLPYYDKGILFTGDVTQLSKVPAFSFMNQDSLPLNEDFVKGKVWVAHYFFVSCPTICPIMVNSMKLVQEAYNQSNEVRMISLTVDPKHDKVDVLKKYAGTKHINTDQWQLGTADKKILYQFARKGLYIIATDGDGGTDDFIHSDRLVLIDQNRHVRGYYDGLDESDVDHLIKDIKRLRND